HNPRRLDTSPRRIRSKSWRERSWSWIRHNSANRRRTANSILANPATLLDRHALPVLESEMLMLRLLSSLRVCLICLALDCVPRAAWGEEAVQIKEPLSAGYRYLVSTRVELSGSITLPSDKAGSAPNRLDISGQSAIEYDERVLNVDKAGQVTKTIRNYRRVELQRKIG